jgi:hypothetical protein
MRPHVIHSPPSPPPSHFVGVNVIAQNQLSFRGQIFSQQSEIENAIIKLVFGFSIVQKFAILKLKSPDFYIIR